MAQEIQQKRDLLRVTKYQDLDPHGQQKEVY